MYNENEIFASINLYLTQNNWRPSIIPGTYCKIRKYLDDTTFTSATMSIPEKDIYLNIIIKCPIKENPQITFGVLGDQSGKRTEYYRIDYTDKQKWHLNLDEKDKKHYKVAGLNKWTDWSLVVDLIDRYGQSLPQHYS